MSKMVKKFFSLKLSYRITICFLLGLIFGLWYRFAPESFKNLHIDVPSFKILGTIFINLIKMIIAPLIFTSIVSSIISVGDGKKAGKITIQASVAFIVMTAICVFVGIVSVLYFKPGQNVSFDKQSIIESNADSIGHITGSKNAKTTTIMDFVINIVPQNIFESFVNNDFLQIIFFASIFAVAIIRIGDRAKSVANSITVLSDTMFGISDVVMNFAPFGIFGLTAWLFGTQNVALIKSLGLLVLTLYGACFFVIYVLYGLFALIVLRINPIHFYKKMLPLQFLGYILASSSAVMPSTLSVCINRLGISKEKTNFIVPLGATVNMNGGAIHLGMATIFVAQLWNIDFTTSQLFTVGFLCCIGAVGTAPVPGASIFLLAGILNAMKLPIEAVAIILAVDRVLDMMRTFTNISGDVFSALIVDRIDGTFDEKIYKSK